MMRVDGAFPVSEAFRVEGEGRWRAGAPGDVPARAARNSERRRRPDIGSAQDDMTNGEVASRADRVSAPQVVVLEMQQGRMKNNNYLVVDGETRQAVLVDPAWQMEKIEDALARTGVSLREVLITHSHPDHVHLAKEVSARHDCPIRMSEREIAFSGFDAPRLQPVGDTPWRIGHLRIRPLPTPGHTPGCVCYLVGDNLFSGDVLFAEGCGICPDVESARVMFDSLRMLKYTLDPDVRVFPGHTYVRPPGQKFSELMGYNLYLHFDDRDRFAAYRQRAGQRPGKLLDFR